MKCLDEKWRPVAFISKSLSDTERNYEIHNKEILVDTSGPEILRGMETFPGGNSSEI